MKIWGSSFWCRDTETAQPYIHFRYVYTPPPPLVLLEGVKGFNLSYAEQISLSNLVPRVSLLPAPARERETLGEAGHVAPKIWVLDTISR